MNRLPRGTRPLTEEREEFLWLLGHEEAHRKWLERGRPEDHRDSVYDSETLFVDTPYTGKKHEGQAQFWEELAAFQRGAESFFTSTLPVARANPHSRHNPMSREALASLCSLLDVLVATRWVHLTSHWRASGADYGDHLLYERLYKKVDEEIDDLAEQLVQLGGGPSVDSAEMLSDAADHIRQIEDPEPQKRLAHRALAVERSLVRAIDEVRGRLQQMGALSTGLDNLLSGIADTHNKHLYLLQQRLSGP